MKVIPWKKIALGATILTALILVRAAVTVGRALYFGGDALAEVRADPWMYVGLAALAIAVISWVTAFRKPADAMDEETGQMEV